MSGAAPGKRLTPWGVVRSQWLPLAALALYAWAFSADPEGARRALALGARTLASVLPIVVAVFGLVGLIQVWLSRDLVARLLGREGGMRALLIAAACGTVLIGPAYIIFPLLMSIRRQGARWAVIAIVLASYAVKVQMLPLEVEFLGWRFSLARSLLTVLAAIPLGLAVEAVMERRPVAPPRF